MDIIDTHSHPQFPQYDTDRDEVIRRALDAGVGMICVGTDEATSRQAIALAEQYEGVWASVGIHPNDTGGFMKVQEVIDLASHPKVVAIGEVGLDYYRTTEHVAQENQRELFKKFLTVDKPRIIHCRDSAERVEGQANAHEDMLGILQSTSYDRHPSGVIHSFTGTLTQALLYIERGYYIGFNGIVTFLPAGRQTHGQYDEVVKNIPLERILLETDSPYLTPVPHRGTRNESSYVHEVASMVAQLRGISKEEVMKVTTKNARSLFSI